MCSACSCFDRVISCFVASVSVCEALKRSIDPLRRYYNFISIDNYLDGRQTEMVHAARMSADGGSAVAHLLFAIALTKSPRGSNEKAAGSLEQLAELDSTLAADPGRVLRRHGATEEVVDALESGSLEAGWSAPDLVEWAAQ